MSEMRLWPEELESLRAESRSITDSALPMFAQALGSPDTPPAERLLHLRNGMKALAAPVEGPMPEAGERHINGVRCRTFVPERDPLGLYLQIHGGGMCLGFPEMSDADNLRRCRELGLVIVSPEYRLAPEHPYPAQFEDLWTVVTWLMDNAEAEWGVGPKFVMGGDSSGAYFTAGTALRVRDELCAVDRIAGVNLVYASYDLSRTPSMSGVRATGNGDCLDLPALRMFGDSYLPGLSLEQRRDPAISPMWADLRPFPRTLLTVGLDDHALDDSLFFGSRLAAAGNRVELAVYPDSMHGFLSLPTKMAARAAGRIDDFLVDCLSDS